MPLIMRSRNSIAALFIMLILSACANVPDSSKSKSLLIPIDSLVSTQWLSEHISDPDVVVIDANVVIEMDENGMRSLSGRSFYERGHIPSAGFADLTSELRNVDSNLDYALPTPEQFVAVMSALGVNDNSRVVLYDAYGSGWAARVWWMLRWVGFDNAAILDGGFGAWTTEGRALSTDAAIEPKGNLSLKLRPEIFTNRDEVFAAIDNQAVTIIDALPASHYQGNMQMYARSGHIPSAVNIPAFSLLDADGRYKSDDELDMSIELDRSKRTITYCGGGISASNDAFILHRLGFTNVAVYSPSLQEWAADEKNPLVTDK